MALTARQWAALILTVVLACVAFVTLRSETPETPKTSETPETHAITSKTQSAEDIAKSAIADAKVKVAEDAITNAEEIAANAKSLNTQREAYFQIWLEELNNDVSTINNALIDGTTAYKDIQTLADTALRYKDAFLKLELPKSSINSERWTIVYSNVSYIVDRLVPSSKKHVEKLARIKADADGIVSELSEFIQIYEDGMTTVLSAAKNTAAAATQAKNAFDVAAATALAVAAASASEHLKNTVTAADNVSAAMTSAEEYYNEAVLDLYSLKGTIHLPKNTAIDNVRNAQGYLKSLIELKETWGLNNWILT